MFRLTVRDHVMIAHSLPHPNFGPAQQLHGATYVVELTVTRAELGEDGTVIDIGVLAATLAEVLAELNYRNLDEHPALTGLLTTTEVMARHIAEQVAGRLPTAGLIRLEVLLREHPDAWAAYVLEL
ncbi:MAG TPA: 6-carboxytetrahydropterin synthase [Microlunatus sp.]|nr:6-carboxytetrahydropterin synthase [Microlunatus sp.]